MEAQKSVRVEQNNVTPLCQFKSDIIGSAEAEVYFTADHSYVRKFLLNHFDRAIVRVVVYDEYLDAKFAGFALYRLQRLAQDIARVEGHNNE